MFLVSLPGSLVYITFVDAKLVLFFNLRKSLQIGMPLTLKFGMLVCRKLQISEKMKKKLDYDYCRAAPILEWLGDKWALVVLMKISECGVVRFSELCRQIPVVSEKMLSSTLRSLETDGMIVRRVYPVVPPKVEYSLSGLGESFLPHLEGLVEWGRANFDAIMSNRRM